MKGSSVWFPIEQLTHMLPFQFQTSMRELLAIEGEGDENVSRDGHRDSGDCSAIKFGEFEEVVGPLEGGYPGCIVAVNGGHGEMVARGRA